MRAMHGRQWFLALVLKLSISIGLRGSQEGVFPMLDRSEINRALAKAIAYKNCGKDRKASAWAAELVRLLECADILTQGAQRDLHRMD